MEEKSFVVVGGVEYPVVKTGRAQARQVAGLMSWLSKYGSNALGKIETDGIGSGLEFILGFIGGLDEDALVDLFILAIGCTKEVAEVDFDVAILVEAVMAIYEQQPAIKKLLDRFFSSSSSTKGTGTESSTKSE